MRERAIGKREEIAVVSFDLDDTFWDCKPALLMAEEHLYGWLEKNTPRVTTALDREALLSFRTEFREAHPELTGCVTAMRLQGLRELMRTYRYSESLADEAFKMFHLARNQVTVYQGVEAMLKAVSNRYRVAAITNGNADLNLIGLDQYFNRIYTADLTLKAKPAPDMFDQCCAHFDVDPSQMLHVGDSPAADVKGALEAGAQSLWFNQFGQSWPHPMDPPHYEARSIQEIKSFLTD
ncbi:MAG: HAD-IA family hydrolase [Granulosicoccus sp.]|nr:HAD-IA family hydrolase [Granulosicoccus sp.]